MKKYYNKEFLTYVLKNSKITIICNIIAVLFLYTVAYLFYRLNNNSSILSNIIIVTIASIVFTFFIFKSTHIEYSIYKHEIIKNKLNACYYDSRVPLVGSRDVYLGIELYNYLMKHSNEVVLKSINPILSNELKPLNYCFNNPKELIHNITDLYE